MYEDIEAIQIVYRNCTRNSTHNCISKTLEWYEDIEVIQIVYCNCTRNSTHNSISKTLEWYEVIEAIQIVYRTCPCNSTHNHIISKFRTKTTTFLIESPRTEHIGRIEDRIVNHHIVFKPGLRTLPLPVQDTFSIGMA